jgi:hypothetical protein
MARKRVVRRNPVNRRRTSRLMAHRRNASFGGGVKARQEVFEDTYKIAQGDTTWAKGKKAKPKSVFATGKHLSRADAQRSFDLGYDMGAVLVRDWPELFTKSANGVFFNAWAATIRKLPAYDDAMWELDSQMKGMSDQWFSKKAKGKAEKSLWQEMKSNAFMRVGMMTAWQKKFVQMGGSFASKSSPKKKTPEKAKTVKVDIETVGRKRTPPKTTTKKVPSTEKVVGTLSEGACNELFEKIEDLHEAKEKMVKALMKSNPALRRAGSSRYTSGFQYTPWMKPQSNPRRRGSKLPVPTRMTRTPRSAAEGVYVLPKLEKFPIGDLFHARMAVNYVLGFPSNRKYTRQVVRAVQRDYPDYAWGRYWRSKIQAYQAKMKKEQKRANKILAWGELSKPPKRRKRGRAVANPWMLI